MEALLTIPRHRTASRHRHASRSQLGGMRLMAGEHDHLRSLAQRPQRLRSGQEFVMPPQRYTCSEPGNALRLRAS
jgi:hypothetical protein